MADKKKFNIMIVVMSLSMVTFWQILASYFWGNKLIALDGLVNDWIIKIRRPFINEIMLLATTAGSGWTILVGSLLGGIVLLISGRKKCFSGLVVSCLMGLVFVGFLKYAIGRFRPPVENAVIRMDGFSLPSGHSFFGLMFYGLVTYFLMKHFANWRKKVVIFLAGFGFIMLLAISRVYLGVHWLTDIIAGLATSLVWLSLVVIYFENKQIYFKEKKKIDDKKMIFTSLCLVCVWCLVVAGQFILVR